MGRVTINVEDYELRVDHQMRFALPFRTDKRRIDFITFAGEGPQTEFMSVDSFDKRFKGAMDDEPHSYLAKMLKACKRAYLPGPGVAAILLEMAQAVTLHGKEPKDCAVHALVDYLNILRKASGTQPATDKTYKSKAKLLEAVQAAKTLAQAMTPEQLNNKKQNAAAADKRLAGLADLKARKAEDAEARRAKKADKATTSGEVAMTAIKPAKKADTKSEKSAPAAKVAPKKGAAVEKPARPAKVETKPEKTAKPAAKAKKETTEKAGRGKGIGAFCMDLILKGKSNEETAEAARSKFGGTTSASSVAWYRNKLKSEGRLK